MQTLEALAQRIETTEDLHAIVRTMKSLSAVSIRQYESAVAALRDYGRTIDLALRALLRDRAGVDRAPAPERGPVVAVVFGSDHGLCGRFNDEVARFARERIREIDAAGSERRCLAVGTRADARLAALGVTADACEFLPASVGGLTVLAQSVLVQIDAWGAVDGPGRVLLVHNRRTAQVVAVPRLQLLLPVDVARLRARAGGRWPSRGLPAFTMDPGRLLSAVVRQYLFASVYRAAAESLASEHASRLAAMEAAERSIEEHLEAQHLEFSQRRQHAITEELLDILTGFEASGGGGEGAC